MFKLKKLLYISIFILTFTQCDKKEEPQHEKEPEVQPEELRPTAAFTFNKEIYASGEVIIATNTSTNAASVKWTLPDGTTSSENTLSYSTSATADNLALTFKLEAYSASGNKTDYIIKNVQVVLPSGRITVYAKDLGPSIPMGRLFRLDSGPDIQKTFTIKYAQTPDCNDDDTYTFEDVKQGEHKLDWKIGAGSYSIKVNVVGGQCVVVGI
jgi:PKD repeat protein